MVSNLTISDSSSKAERPGRQEESSNSQLLAPVASHDSIPSAPEAMMINSPLTFWHDHMDIFR